MSNTEPYQPRPPPAAPPEASTQGGCLRVWAFGASDVGLVREHNEDAYLMADLTQSEREWSAQAAQPVGPCGMLFLVCDGMGGAAAGEVASGWAKDTVYAHMRAVMQGQPGLRGDGLARALVQALEAANRRIFEESVRNCDRRGMGTTITAAILVDDHLFMAQVGDSRAYILRDQSLTQVTRDQSLVNQLIEAGSLTEEEAEHFEHHNIILQAAGTAASIDADVTHAHLRHGDLLVLCSDGLSGLLKEAELREAMVACSDPGELCHALIQRAKAAGGHDNITVIAARIEGAIGTSQGPAGDVLRFQRYVFAERPDVATQPLIVSSRPTENMRTRTGQPDNQQGLGRGLTPSEPRQTPQSLDLAHEGAAASAALARQPTPATTRALWWLAFLLWMVAVAAMALLLLPRN